MEGFWKATSISGKVYGLFRVEKSGDWYKTYRYRDGAWVADDEVYFKFGWDDDYDHITDAEAKQIMEAMDRAE